MCALPRSCFLGRGGERSPVDLPGGALLNVLFPNIISFMFHEMISFAFVLSATVLAPPVVTTIISIHWQGDPDGIRARILFQR